MKSAIGTVFLAVFSFVAVLAMPAPAQQNDVVWVQIEAQPSLAGAQDRARTYAARLPDVSGFYLGGGWYGIALGPYSQSDADQVLNVYRAEGAIPRDSYIAFSSSFRQQFWPVGANVLNRGVVEAPLGLSAPEPEAEPVFSITPRPTAEETPREARRRERDLTREERETLQIALKWAGFYNAAIDGSFGPGTRNSMANWQSENGYEATGILTTLQRNILTEQYDSVLDGMDLELARDAAIGIEIQVPSGVVAFDKYEPPFAHYAPTGDIDARVLLISQAGNQDTLYGLYDIMQTLEIVPLAGPRERDKDSFRLIGEDGSMISQTEVRLEDGQIKGFTLIWPAGDEDRRRRVLGEMQRSFNRIDGVLSATASLDQEQRIDLLAGLEIRQPRVARSGFYVDASGSVVTTSDAVQGCTRITLDNEYEAQLVTSDSELGIAVIRPEQSLAPLAIALFTNQPPRLQSEVALGGYSFGGVLGAPTVTFGKLADLRGLRGEKNLKRLSLSPLPGDAGGPVLDSGGRLLGMLLPVPANGQNLPEDVSFAIDGASIRTLLDGTGLSVNSVDAGTDMAAEDLRALSAGMTVLVSCWE